MTAAKDGAARVMAKKKKIDETALAAAYNEALALEKAGEFERAARAYGKVLVLDPEAPGRQAFDGLRWFPADARFIVPARWEPDPELPSIELSTSRGLSKTFVRAGVLRAELLGQPIALAGYRSGAVEGGPLLVPLTDETTGTSTYPVGRYLEVALPAEGAPVLDLNRLTNPWCAYSEHFNCPVPPAENRLPVAVEAGEEIYDQH